MVGRVEWRWVVMVEKKSQYFYPQQHTHTRAYAVRAQLQLEERHGKLCVYMCRHGKIMCKYWWKTSDPSCKIEQVLVVARGRERERERVIQRGS